MSNPTQEALDKATQRFRDMENNDCYACRRISREALSEINAILNPPRYVVRNSNTTEMQFMVRDHERLVNVAWFITREDADHIAALLNQEEERDGD